MLFFLKALRTLQLHLPVSEKLANDIFSLMSYLNIIGKGK